MVSPENGQVVDKALQTPAVLHAMKRMGSVLLEKGTLLRSTSQVGLASDQQSTSIKPRSISLKSITAMGAIGHQQGGPKIRPGA
jgi:hypothetical protein